MPSLTSGTRGPYAPPVNGWDRFHLEAYEKLRREKVELVAEKTRLAVRVGLLEQQVEASARTSASLRSELERVTEERAALRDELDLMGEHPLTWGRSIWPRMSDWNDSRTFTPARFALAALLLALAGAVGAAFGLGE